MTLKEALRDPDEGKRPAPAEEVRLGTFLGPNSLLDLDAGSKKELLCALAEAVARERRLGDWQPLYQATCEREAVVSTYLGEGVAIPHARVPGFEGFALAIARNRKGFPYEVETAEPVQLAILLVGNESLQHEHVRLLAAIASAIKDPQVRADLLGARDAQEAAKILDAGGKGPPRRRRPGQLSKLLLSHARTIAKDIGATAVLVAIESLEELAILKRLPRRDSFIIATRSAHLAESAEKLFKRVLRLPSPALSRDTLVRLGTLMGITSGFISRDDVVAFLSGQHQSGLDTITVLAINKEFGRFLTASGEISTKVSPGVLERVLSLASEISSEGREGRPIGTIFVIGDPEELAPYCQRLVINPFRGYPEEGRRKALPRWRVGRGSSPWIEAEFEHLGVPLAVGGNLFQLTLSDALGREVKKEVVAGLPVIRRWQPFQKHPDRRHPGRFLPGFAAYF